MSEFLKLLKEAEEELNQPAAPDPAGPSAAGAELDVSPEEDTEPELGIQVVNMVRLAQKLLTVDPQQASESPSLQLPYSIAIKKITNNNASEIKKALEIIAGDLDMETVDIDKY